MAVVHPCEGKEKQHPCEGKEKKQKILGQEILDSHGELQFFVKAIARDYDEMFRTEFETKAIDPSKPCRIDVTLGESLRTAVAVLGRIATDARGRLHALTKDADAALDLVRRDIGIFWSTPDIPTWLFDESATLADWHGFDPVFTVFACLPVAMMIDEVLAEPMSHLAAYPNDVRVDALWNCDASDLTVVVSAHDALLMPCVQVVSGLTVLTRATLFACTWVRAERDRRGRCSTATSPRPQHDGPFFSFRSLLPCFARVW